MKINFEDIFSSAWKITWNHKILWIFGFLAMLGCGSGDSGGGGGANFNINNSSSAQGSQLNPFGAGHSLPPALSNFFDSLSRLDTTALVAIIAGVCLCLFVLWLVIQVLSILGQGSLIGGIDCVETNSQVTLGQAWGVGRRCFWRLVLLRLLRFAVDIAITIFLFLPMICLCICTCGLGAIVLGIAIGFFIQYVFAFMDMAVVVEGMGVGESISRAYSMLRNHLGTVFVLALILFVISLGIGFVSLVLFIPFGGLLVASLWPLITSTGEMIMPLMIAAIVMLVLGILAAMLVRAVWTTYRMSVLVLAYKQIQKDSSDSPALVTPTMQSSGSAAS